MKVPVGIGWSPTVVTPYEQRKPSMKSFYLLNAGLLAALLAGGAAAQFNTDALKKMQKEGHKIVEEEQAAKAAGGKTAAARRAYRVGNNLCLDGRGALTVETCNARSASQQWAMDGSGRLVAEDGRCLAGASLAKCAGGQAQKWTHDDRGRLRNAAQRCLQPASVKAGAAVTAVACGAAPAQVWVAVGPTK